MCPLGGKTISPTGQWAPRLAAFLLFHHCVWAGGRVWCLAWWVLRLWSGQSQGGASVGHCLSSSLHLSAGQDCREGMVAGDTCASPCPPYL